MPLMYSTTGWLVSNESGTPAKHVTLKFKWSRRQFPSVPVSACVLEMRCFQILIRFSWCIYLFILHYQRFWLNSLTCLVFHPFAHRLWQIWPII